MGREQQIPPPHRAVYGISVAAELVGMGVQNLRLYEARGLLEPHRTDGGTRRYSADDLERLRRIGDLLEAGLNLAGIGMVLDLEAQNRELRAAQGPAGHGRADQPDGRATRAGRSRALGPDGATPAPRGFVRETHRSPVLCLDGLERGRR